MVVIDNIDVLTNNIDPAQRLHSEFLFYTFCKAFVLENYTIII